MTDERCSHPGSTVVETYPDGAVLYQCTGCDDQWVEDPAT